MCLIIFSWHPEASHPLVLTANRDETYNRPTRSVHVWEDYPEIIGGRDEKCRGSWLAINRQGKFAAVTNFREIPTAPTKQSRGHLVSDFLIRNIPAKDYLYEVQLQDTSYAGFNLLVGDSTGLFYHSNRRQGVQVLKPGTYGLSNHLLDTPWPKVKKAKAGFSRIMSAHQGNPPTNALLSLMTDHSLPSDRLLPDTGVGLEKERFLASCFIKSDDYGTRNTTILKMSLKGDFIWNEQIFGIQGLKKGFYELTATKTT